MRDTTIDPITVLRDLEETMARAPHLEAGEVHRPGEATAQEARRPSAHPAPSSLRVMEMMDRAVAQVLRVQPQPPTPREAGATTGGRPFETPLLIAGLRCTLRYIVLPFVLPLLGVATGATLGVLLLLDGIAAISIVATLRRLWRLQHPRRWQYLAVALAMAVLIGFFFVKDVRVLFV
jgi:hypothetical protein